MTISEDRLKDAERIVRLIMIVILLTAGTSKLFSQGGFFEYYASLFQGALRINLPAGLVNIYLAIIPIIELGLGVALLFNGLRIYAIYGWFAFMLSLLFGHYILQEFGAVNQMLDYFFLGLACLFIPSHDSWLARPTLTH